MSSPISQSVIGITCGEVHNKIEKWSPVTFGQSRTYVDSIIAAGGVPVLLPLSEDEAVLQSVFQLLDGICLAGGNDISPSCYHQTPYEGNYYHSPLRDTTEEKLLTWALRDKMPILGICRGMQFLNVHCGGDLYQHIPTDLPGSLDHDASTKSESLEDTSHTLRIAASSKLADILGVTTIGANAHHHQAVHTLGQGLQATAWAQDGVIEAIELTNYPYAVAVQSHPESLISIEPAWLRLFISFVDAAKKK